MQDLQKRHFEIMEFARSHTAVTRPVLADRLGVSLPTVSVAVRELLDAEVLVEDGYLKSSGGRRARVLRLNPDFLHSLGLSVSVSGVRGVLADLSGRIIEERYSEWEAGATRDAVLETLFAVTGALLEAAVREPAGIGCGISGLVRRMDGVSMRFPHVEDWREVPVGAMLEERFGLEAFLDNDVNASTLAELRFGSGRGLENFLYAFIGRGIGLGIVVNGRLYRGASGNAGELGHLAMGPDGVLCHCGNYGCLETVAGPEAVLAEVRQALDSGAVSSIDAGGEINIMSVLAAAEAGDRLAENVIGRAAEHLGRMFANMANLFDPEVIIVGGLLTRASDKIMAALRRVFDSRVLPSIAPTVELKVSPLGDTAGALGAADVVFQNRISAMKGT